ncbi:hypothetical protein BH09MYX1_BH09MYX1_28820 [soil metagenome]
MNRRDHILAAATRLFAERGYEGASMSDLAERVGLRKASLFHHLASKDKLREAVLERLVAGVGAAIAVAASAEGSFEVRLDTLTAALVRVLATHPYAARVILREGMEWTSVETGAIPVAVQSVLGAAVEFVAAGQREGAFRSGDPAHMIVSLIGLHFMPFVIGGVVERLGGIQPFAESYVEARVAAMTAQVRGLILASQA